MTSGEQRRKPRFSTGLIVAFFFVVGALAILAALLAVPSLIFRPYRPKAPEAKTNLGALFTAQVAYFAEYNTFTGGKNCFTHLGWAPEGDTIYAYYCGGDVIPPFKPKTATHKCTSVTPLSSNFGFTVCAAGNLDKDATVDTWSMNDSKILRNDVNDVGN